MAQQLPDTNTIGNVLAGVAAAFLVDNVAMGGTVTKSLPSEIIGLVAYVVFVGVVIYVVKQAAKLN